MIAPEDASNAANQSPDNNVREEWRESPAGYQFDLHAKNWRLDSKIVINTSHLRELFQSETLKNGCVRTYSYDATKKAPISIRNNYSTLKNFFRFVAKQRCHDEITLSAVTNYRDERRRLTGYDREMASVIRPFLKLWYSLGHSGVSHEVVQHISRWRLKLPEPGVAVNREDVNEGPLMPDEHVSLEAQWLAAFENGQLSLDQFASLRLISITGRRPIQLASLKLKDLDDSRVEDAGGNVAPKRIYLVHIPRAKGNGRRFRTHFRSVPVSVDFWSLLVRQRDQVSKTLDVLLRECGISLQHHDLTHVRNEMPLFPFWYEIRRSITTLGELVRDRQHGNAISGLRDLVAGESWHRRRTFIDELLRTVDKFITTKNREGEDLRLFARRFRYTIEFNLGRNGCQPAVIAWNLDHSNTRHLTSYSQNGPDKARRLSKAMALKLKPYVNMFQGKVVDTELDVPDTDPHSARIVIENGVHGASCARNRSCGSTAIPRSCYNGCPQFRPWVDGPHEQYLTSLLEERERDLQLLRDQEDRNVIEAADSLILGVVQVIQLCEDRRAELAKTKGASKNTNARGGAAK